MTTRNDPRYLHSADGAVLRGWIGQMDMDYWADADADAFRAAILDQARHVAAAHDVINPEEIGCERVELRVGGIGVVSLWEDNGGGLYLSAHTPGIDVPHVLELSGPVDGAALEDMVLIQEWAQDHDWAELDHRCLDTMDEIVTIDLVTPGIWVADRCGAAAASYLRADADGHIPDALPHMLAHPSQAVREMALRFVARWPPA